MIKLQDALITDALPSVIASELWAQAMAQAVRVEMRKILEFAKNARLYAAIDFEPEPVIDLMAKDLQVQEYNQSYDIETKRALVKIALQRWSKAGTKAVVEELCSKIFGDATVQEWKEYGGRPYYFKVICTNPAINDSDINQFKRAIESVKRLSAWLDNIELLLEVEPLPLREGFSLYTVSKEHYKLTFDVVMKMPTWKWIRAVRCYFMTRENIPLMQDSTL